MDRTRVHVEVRDWLLDVGAMQGAFLERIHSPRSTDPRRDVDRPDTKFIEPTYQDCPFTAWTMGVCARAA
jgi:hypothetical protein